MKKSTMTALALVFAAFCAPACAESGCGGYTTRSLLPPEYKTIYVANVANDIRVTAEQSNMRMYRGYRPGMENDLTRAVINRFLFDGNLKPVSQEKSDLVLQSSLIDFRREPLRFDSNDNIEEYRIKLIVNMTLTETGTGKVVWQERGFAGETTYFTSGSLAKGEQAALNEAILDIARRIVERTVEAW